MTPTEYEAAIAEYRATIEQNERTIARLDEALENALLGHVFIMEQYDNWEVVVRAKPSSEFPKRVDALAYARKLAMGDGS